MAFPTSLSPNIGKIRISGEDALYYIKWNSLESIILNAQPKNVYQ